MLGAGAPAERFGRSHPSRQIGPSRAVGSLSNQVLVFLSRARNERRLPLANPISPAAPAFPLVAAPPSPALLVPGRRPRRPSFPAALVAGPSPRRPSSPPASRCSSSRSSRAPSASPSRTRPSPASPSPTKTPRPRRSPTTSPSPSPCTTATGSCPPSTPRRSTRICSSTAPA